MCRRLTGPSSPAASITTSARSNALARDARPTSARASSSRSPTRRRIRCVERSAERAASRSAPCSDSTSSSRFASTLVSGVRSSCEASATKRRWRSSVASVSLRARVERAEHALQRARELGDLVVGVRLGQRAARVARALDLGGGRGQLGDRRDRAARDVTPAAREAGPASTPEREQQLEARDSRRRRERPRVLDDRRRRDRVAARDG